MLPYVNNFDSVVSSVAQAVEREGVLVGIRRVGLAVSGGADSVALVELMAPICRSQGIEAVVVNVDHGRPGESAGTRLAQAAAERQGVPFVARRGSLCVAEGASIEAPARALRLRLLAEVVQERKLDAVMAGHTADDALETLLLRACRGSGIEGLAGLRRTSFNGVLKVLRPLLHVSHRALCGYLKNRGLDWFEDADNVNPTSMRVRMRTSVLPALERAAGESVRASLWRTVQLLAEDADVLSARLSDELARCARGEGLDAECLRRLDEPGRRRVLRAWLLAQGAAAATGWETLVRLAERAGEGVDFVQDLPDGWRVSSTRGVVALAATKAK